MTEVVVVSNRGPIAFVRDDDQLIERRGAGGLVSGLAPILRDTGSVWVAAAMTEGDRELASSGRIAADGFELAFVDVAPDDYTTFYDEVCNSVLWFVHHGMFDHVREPTFGRQFRAAWATYEDVNARFAAVVAAVAPPSATVLVQDYHLTLVGELLAASRPDLRTVHFSHTPFAGPDELRVLPEEVTRRMVGALAAHDAVSFHTERWADNFRASHAALFGTDPACRVAITPLGADADDLTLVASADATMAAADRLDALVADARVIARVDRVEPSKNLVRGFRAYDLLLEEHPEWRERVVFVAAANPSREGSAAYRRYAVDVEATVSEINQRWATDAWTPIIYESSDDFPRSIALLQRCDVLLVNPIRDGLNLVALEGPLVSQRDTSLVLSAEAGIVDTLAEAAFVVHPFDLVATADALHAALSLDPDERAARAKLLRLRAESRTPADWLADQLAAAHR